jgi:ribosomal protein S18 acetylase RimI-like enzyme
MIRSLKENDITQWKIIIREVEPLFGPMLSDPGFIPAISEAIISNMVFGYEDDETHQIIGAIVINRDSNNIEWLAVSNRQKQNGIGSKLLERALSELDKNQNIYVQTFSQEVEAGIAARKLYEKYGFVDLKDAGKNPAGLDTVIMIKKSS